MDMARVIAVINPTEKTGKTTIVSNLGEYYAKNHNRVLMVDLDRKTKALRLKYNVSKNHRQMIPEYNLNLYVDGVFKNIDKQYFDIILIDSPSESCAIINESIDRSDYVLIPHAHVMLSFNGITNTVDLIKGINPELPYGIVIDDYKDSIKDTYNLMVKRVDDNFPGIAFKAIIKKDGSIELLARELGIKAGIY